MKMIPAEKLEILIAEWTARANDEGQNQGELRDCIGDLQQLVEEAEEVERPQ